jgi:hypothetical protein
VPRKKDDEALGWLILGGFLGILAGAVLAKGSAGSSYCPRCSKDVPYGAPMCPWCQVPLFWSNG